jgi:tripeptidyl-peptidase-1
MGRAIQLIAALGLFLVLASAAYLETDEAYPLPANWFRLDGAKPAERRVDLLIALKQRNLDQLDSTFWAVSTPGNPRYGKHLSMEQIADLIAPTNENIVKVLFWLKSQGVRDAKLLKSRDFITCSVTVAQAEEIFAVKFHNYQHRSGAAFAGTLGPYSVPEEIAEHVDLVSGLVGIPDLEVRKKPQLGASEATDKDITPVIIRSRYNVSSTLVVTNANNSHAVAEFQGQYYSPSDLALFFKNYVPFASAQTIANVIGPNVGADPGIEASLDVQYLMGVAPNATTSFYSYASFNFFNDLLNWTATLASAPSIPWIHSVSYGTQGNYPAASVISKLDTQFQVIGTRGASVVIASGDDGSGCQTNDAEFCETILYPSYPGSSPYVTAIGATRFLTANSGPEGAVQAFGSGGGFFSGDTQPSYQTSAVSGYLGTNPTLPPACAYNQANRATPDASALGDVHFQVVVNGGVTAVGGTSASTPTFSAIFTLLNDIRLNNGQAPLGFLNPWIYQNSVSSPTAFFDVTVGNNVVSSCGTNGGFQCAVGWDPVTGVGTPNFAVLSTLF